MGLSAERGKKEIGPVRTPSGMVPRTHLQEIVTPRSLLLALRTRKLLITPVMTLLLMTISPNVPVKRWNAFLHSTVSKKVTVSQRTAPKAVNLWQSQKDPRTHPRLMLLTSSYL